MLCIRSGFFLHRAAVIGGLRRGTGSLVRCAFASFFLALCSYSHFSGHTFSVLRLQAPPRGGENGAQPVLMERACPRAKGGAPALLPSCPACPWQGRALPCCRPRLLARCPSPASLSSFPSVRPGPSPCRFFCCALRSLPPGASAVPHAVCCAEARPPQALCLVFPSVPSPLPSWPLRAPASPRRRSRHPRFARRFRRCAPASLLRLRARASPRSPRRFSRGPAPACRPPVAVSFSLRTFSSLPCSALSPRHRFSSARLAFRSSRRPRGLTG